MNSTLGGILVTNGAESSLVLEVKEKQEQTLILLDMNTSVHSERVLTFEKGGDGVLK